MRYYFIILLMFSVKGYSQGYWDNKYFCDDLPQNVLIFKSIDSALKYPDQKKCLILYNQADNRICELKKLIGVEFRYSNSLELILDLKKLHYYHPLLEYLSFKRSKLRVVPEEINKFNNLKHLSFIYEDEIISLPNDIGDLSSLKSMYFIGCSKDSQSFLVLPVTFKRIHKLEKFHVDYTNFIELSDNLIYSRGIDYLRITNSIIKKIDISCLYRVKKIDISLIMYDKFDLKLRRCKSLKIIIFKVPLDSVKLNNILNDLGYLKQIEIIRIDCNGFGFRDKIFYIKTLKILEIENSRFTIDTILHQKINIESIILKKCQLSSEQKKWIEIYNEKNRNIISFD